MTTHYRSSYFSNSCRSMGREGLPSLNPEKRNNEQEQQWQQQQQPQRKEEGSQGTRALQGEGK